jgi:hypothetical protein
MHTWFDPFGKELLAEALDGTGRVELEFEVRSAPQSADMDAVHEAVLGSTP